MQFTVLYTVGAKLHAFQCEAKNAQAAARRCLHERKRFNAKGEALIQIAIPNHEIDFDEMMALEERC